MVGSAGEKEENFSLTDESPFRAIQPPPLAMLLSPKLVKMGRTPLPCARENSYKRLGYKFKKHKD